jgi:hypothetical protein
LLLYLEHPLFGISLNDLLNLLNVIVEYRSLHHGGCHPLLVVILLLLCPIAIFELLLPLLPRKYAVRAIHHYHLALLLFGRVVLIDALTKW